MRNTHGASHGRALRQTRGRVGGGKMCRRSRAGQEVDRKAFHCMQRFLRSAAPRRRAAMAHPLLISFTLEWRTLEWVRAGRG